MTTAVPAAEQAAQAREGAALVLDRIAKTYRGAGGGVAALGPVDLEVWRGEFVSIVGPSGCGKSTLFSIVGGLAEEYDGRVLIDGRAVRGPQREIGMVFQEESTFPWLSALENVAFPLRVAGVARAERETRARRMLRLVGLEGFEGARPAKLSGGMRQRTALARTLIAQPRILLMDEPFAALDEQTRLLLGDRLLDVWRELEQTTLLITHSIAEAVQLSDRVVVMTFRPGRVKRIVKIDLPRPRTSAILGSERFGHFVSLIWSELRDEALRGLDAREERC
ncbi:ATP-binding protein [Vulcanimicrobium alpinum]|uniref:ATP-binding protein n=1 Tax=Vulcanimicrobium alpinum TaxID=3016050 RepID=A0AAN2C9S3_UNVUL|nr:ABC transporter ATP-binding protein [Vulcanimicrobium alpinum]BDE05907.1 ATP-binding protein [Vulcanimicrobium alpinum]